MTSNMNKKGRRLKQRILLAFRSFSFMLKRELILHPTITKIHLNNKRITRNETDLSTSLRAFFR